MALIPVLAPAAAALPVIEIFPVVLVIAATATTVGAVVDVPTAVKPAADETAPVSLIALAVADWPVKVTGPTREVIVDVPLIPRPVPVAMALILTPIFPASVPEVIGPVILAPNELRVVAVADGPLTALLLISM